MSLNAIHFDPKLQDVNFDGQASFNGKYPTHGKTLLVQAPWQHERGKVLSIDAIGKIIARALTQKCTEVRFDRCTVTVNYLVQMLRFIGKTGWFTDVLDTTRDHAFNPNVPTPGYYIGEARTLEADAIELRQMATLYRAASRMGEAEEIELQAREKRGAARRLRYNRS